MTDSSAALPPSVVQFIREHVTSLLQLEALLLVFETGRRARPAAEIAAAMYVPVPAVTDWLDTFCGQGFCELADEGYRLSEEPGMYELLTQVADSYMRRRISLGRLIFSPKYEDPRSSFSDAFRFRRGQ